MPLEAAFAHFPDRTTERMHLRELQTSDAEALFAIKSNPEVTKQYGQEPHKAVADSLKWIKRLRVSYREHLDVAWCMTFKGENTCIGVCTLWNIQPASHCAEIGYELHPNYEKRGLMTEAVSAILDYCFTTLELHRIEATPFADNPASHQLLHKLGFQLEGTLRQRYFFRDHYKDQHYFGLLRADWLKRTAQ